MKVTDVVIVMNECMKVFESAEQANQMKFLDSAMRSDVQNGDRVGRSSIIEEWIYLANLAVVLEWECNADIFEQDMKVGRVCAILVIQLTRRSLATIFPTLTNTRLRDRLLQHSEVRLPMTVLFQFDEQGKVSRYDSSIDFVTALYSVFKDYRDVASLLESVGIDATGQVRGELLPPETRPQKIICSDHLKDRARLESNSDRSISRHDKLSVSFLLSSDGGDTDGHNSNFSEV
ncbi:hypothetical protein PHMEG_000931 [Phytophthora megakarya]|uniref:Uncharacterized protein n=1 Tax=Phytophthora megakarya TaxID=4795 RepID=A0A225X1S2_9STRA|nr:hypothetical protein PHMEG_000931 [Phytophthora megakarya]